jgi:pyrroline-5-carboxylate reductase
MQGFIGTGEITSSVVTGLGSAGDTTHSMRLSPRNSVIASGLANRFHGISVAPCNQELLDHCHNRDRAEAAGCRNHNPASTLIL